MFGATLALSALVAFWFMVILFVIALVRRNTGAADVGWGLAVFIAVLATYVWQMPGGLRAALVLILVAVWGVRLTVHILMRNWGRGEDWRHARARAAWGHWYPLRSFLQVFVLRSVLLVMVAAPALWVVTFGGPPLTWLDFFGLFVWLLGYCFESIADHQLVRFMKTPANHGRVLSTGLWHYSRHPNYFGELLMWWGLWLVALSVPGGWMTVIGPIVLTYWILAWAVPLVESKSLQNSEYRAYARRTDELLPGPPES
ncbi:MAG TPA: DUF1295 domain-containing protein [Candidatus Paceibacterota bacterium]|nr:DUF1295 domain-containing protein [Candidatus Paceibacterota bacterium]